MGNFESMLNHTEKYLCDVDHEQDAHGQLHQYQDEEQEVELQEPQGISF